MDRPSTPPRGQNVPQARSPMTPEAIRQMEVKRLKAKALREQREAEAARQPAVNRQNSTVSTLSAAGQKRNVDGFVKQTAPTSNRDAAHNRPLDNIVAARNARTKIDYDFSMMTDTKGGFLTAEDDPHNKAMRDANATEKNGKRDDGKMTQAEWEKRQLEKSLRTNREANPSITRDEKAVRCRECNTLEIDFKWNDTFKLAVCNACKEKFPEKYSLLTKTEAREDYLLTNPELNDVNIMPHLERPNPHKSTFANMFLYLRCQVEDFAFGEHKWGSPEALDAEFDRRQVETKKRKEARFKSKLADLKKRTKVEAYQRARRGAGGGEFGEDLSDGKHVHEYGRAVDGEDGMPTKKCLTCGLEVEELEL